MTQLHPVIHQLRQLQASEKKWLWLYAASLLLSVMVTTWLLVGLADYFWRSDHPVVRVGLSLVLLFVWGIAIIRFLLPVWRFRRELVDVARTVEAHNPQLPTGLSLATDFLSNSHPDGSAGLRQRLIEQAEHDLRTLSLRDQVNRTVPLRAAAGAIIALLLAAIAVLAEPASAWLAASRTLTPWTSAPWPAVNDLEFDELPAKVALGGSFECVVVDRNSRLPDPIELQIDDGTGLLRRTMNREPGRAIFRMSNLASDFRIRARGGDGDTGWQQVKVVAPPSVEDLSIEVTPPAYSGLAAYSIGPFNKVWSGSRIRIRGKTDQAFQRAEIVWLSSPSESAAETPTETRYPLRNLSSREFVDPTTSREPIDSAQQFRIELIGEEQVTGGTDLVYRLPVREDEPPLSSLNWPTDRRLFAPDDQVRLRLTASDDMQLRSLAVAVSREQQPLQTISVPFSPEPPLMPNRSNRYEVTAVVELDLAELQATDDDGTLEVVATATDSRGQRTNSEPLYFQIGTESELTNLDNQQRAALFELLREVASEQQKTANLTELVIQDSRETPADVTRRRLSQIADSQREIESRLLGPAGARERCQSYLESTSSGRSENNIREVSRARAELTRLETPARLASDQASEALVLAARIEVSRDYLRNLRRQQTRIAETLDRLVGQIDVQTRLQNCLAELQVMLQQQQGLQQQCLRLQSSLGDSSANVEVELGRLRIEQSGLSTRLNELNWGLLNDAEPLDSLALKSLGQSLKLVEIDSKSVEDQLERQQLGLAFQSMDRVSDGLKKILREAEILDPASATFQEQQLKSATEQLESLQQQQTELAGLLDRWESLDTVQQTEAIQTLDALQRQLQTFRQRHGDVLSDAARQELDEIDRLLGRLKEQLQQGQAEAARETLVQVESKLAQIRGELQTEAGRIEQQQREQRLLSLQRQLAVWLEQQTKIGITLDELNAVDAAVFADLLGLQQELTRSIGQQDPQSVGFHALELQLRQLETDSRKLEAALASQQLESARQIADQIIDSLEALVRPSKTPPESDDARQSTQDQGQPTDPQPVDEVNISDFEVTLLQRLQEEILAETRRLEDLRREGLTPRQRAELKDAALNLANRQSDLVEALNRYLAPAEPKPEQPAGPQPIPDIPRIEDLPELPPLDEELRNLPQPDPASGAAVGPPATRRLPISTAAVPQDPREQQDRDEAPVATEPRQEGEDIGAESATARRRLETIRSKMQAVQERLIRQDVSEDNQRLQQEIISEFEFFQADQQKSSRQESRPDEENQLQKSDQSAASSRTAANADEDAAISQTVDENLQKRIDRIWGDLPERIQKTELNIRAEKFLPKYRDLIQAYFKRLANDPRIR